MAANRWIKSGPPPQAAMQLVASSDDTDWGHGDEDATRPAEEAPLPNSIPLEEGEDDQSKGRAAPDFAGVIPVVPASSSAAKLVD